MEAQERPTSRDDRSREAEPLTSAATPAPTGLPVPPAQPAPGPASPGQPAAPRPPSSGQPAAPRPAANAPAGRRKDAFEDDLTSSDSIRAPALSLRLMERLTESAAAQPEAEAFLHELAVELAKATSSSRAIVSLVDPSTDTLELRASHGFGSEPPRELGYVQDGIHGWVRKIGTPMVVDDPEHHHGLPLLPFERTALLAAPIQVGESTLGVISVIECQRESGYREEDMLFVNTVGSLVGGMIGHRRAEEQGRDAVRKAIESLTMALDARDPYTRGHSQRVGMYSLAIANELENSGLHTFGKDMRNSLLMSALLHDIGKIGIRDEILLKAGKLTDDEYDLIKTHPEKGADIVRMIPGFDENVISGILQHHERWDGGGYPQGHTGDKIHIFGRIIGLADAFDAIVTSRPYRSASTFSFAMTRIEEIAGTAFDPDIVRAMLRAMKDQNVWNELGSISQGAAAPEPAEPPKGDSETPDRRLRKIFGRNINDLPTLPHVVSQILEKTRNQDAPLNEIVGIISTDQALVSTLLKLVNSAFYGFSRRITTLKQAITLLGFRSVRNVVVNCGVVGIFRKRTFNNHYRFRLWDHSVTCAVAARTLAQMKGYKAKEEAFTAGLLHDIGKVVIDQYAPKDSAQIMRRVEAGSDPRQAEVDVIGVDHTQVGGWIAERWHLPKTLCWVIEYHHDPASPELPGDPELVGLIATANALSAVRRADDRDALAAAVEDFVASPMNVLKLSPSEAAQALADTWREKADAMKMFGPGIASRTAESEEAPPEPAKAPPVPPAGTDPDVRNYAS